MGVSLEQYRAAIGLHAGGHGERSSGSELVQRTCRSFNMMISLILCISLSITLSNDVESNPGPVVCDVDMDEKATATELDVKKYDVILKSDARRCAVCKTGNIV